MEERTESSSAYHAAPRTAARFGTVDGAPARERHRYEPRSGPEHDDAFDDEEAPAAPRRWPWITATVLLVLVVAIVAAWAVDSSSGGVARNVQLAGVDVGGLAEDQLPARIAQIAGAFAATPVEITSGERTYRTTAAEIGLEVDLRATAAQTLALDDDTFLLARPVVWLSSFFDDRRTDLVLRVNESTARPAIVALEGDDRVAPTEPGVELTDGGFVLVPGVPGQGIDPADLVRSLPRSASSITEPVRVEVRPGDIAPLSPDSAALAAIEEAERLTDEPIEVVTSAGRGTIDAATLRSWVTLTSTDDGDIDLDLHPDRVAFGLAIALGDLEGRPVDASFVVEGGQVRIVPDRDGVVCCADGSTPRLLEALRAGAGSVELDVRVSRASFRTADAEALGVVEEIGSPDEFGPTTRFACCESRVTNIHRIADLVRGVVIHPGETFSVNDHVGRRTVENGFASGGVIINGRFSTEVGGGVSQFATTLFNAALFGGLDFAEYQSHSIYISRYPRGHEATLNYPNVDLVVANNTPYGVLIWPEYTGTSITVRLFSTRHADVTVGTPTSARAGRCTRWTTPRTRVYPDGEVEQDSVFALYRPGEGINC